VANSPERLEAGRIDRLCREKQFLANFCGISTQRSMNALAGPEQVHEKWCRGTLRVFEKQRRTVLAKNALGDFGYFENGIDLCADALQLTCNFKMPDEFL
jgi:hypothetical protein